MTTKRRIITLAIIIAILVVMLFSSVFITLELDHDCTGDHCPICRQIALCEHTCKQLFLAVVAVLITAGLAYLYSLFIPVAIRAEAHNTLITLKVKLSN